MRPTAGTGRISAMNRNMNQKPISDVFSQNNFGSTIAVFPGFTGFDGQMPPMPVPPSVGPAVTGSNTGQNYVQRILTLDAARPAVQQGGSLYLPELMSGNWNIVLDGTPVWISTASASFALDNAIPACPMLARIGFGSGGAQNEVIIDVVPGNSISLPAITAQVDILWGAFPDFGVLPSAGLIADNASADSGGLPILPVNTMITATAVRTAAGFSGTAFRSIFMPRRLSAAADYSVTYQIPNLARKLRVFDQPGATIDSSGLYQAACIYSFEVRNSDGTRPNRSKRITGADVLALNEVGVVIPKNATFLTISKVAGGTGSIGGNDPNRSLPFLEFELSL